MPHERQAMIREQSRISRKKVIAMVPNAACVAYRANKSLREAEGRWPYGLETPILSLREEFEAAGLAAVSEFSVGTKDTLSFLPHRHPLRKALTIWMEQISSDELESCRQGYLLVTIGLKCPKG